MENYNKRTVLNDYQGKLYYEEYRLDDKVHRTDGPARIRYDVDGSIEFIEYWVNGRMHRVDGPAYLVYKQGVEFLYYYLLSKQVTKEQFETPGFIDAFILENS